MNKKLIIVLNGELSDDLEKYKKRLIDNQNFIIACDGGYNNCKKLNIKPDLILGDFDSLQEFEFNNSIKFPKEKDKSDFELAIDYGFEKGFKDFEIWGAIGKRLDHTLFNISLLLRIKKEDGNAIIYHPPYIVFIIDKEYNFGVRNSGFVSFYPLTSEIKGLTIKGMKYELNEKDIYLGSTETLSNEFIGKESFVNFKEGIILVILEEA
ncbi:MAG TPA: thiamine diphosphokinase [Caldisericia bacterium]|nr:thiamine diphosphokinase [Caldisericia bacterium]